MRRLLLFGGLLVGLSAAAWSDPIDPFIGLDDPACPETGLCVGTQFSTNGNGGGTFFFTNQTGETITAVEFQAEVTNFIPASFSCNSVFFLTCTFSSTALDNGDDLLSIEFSGVNAPDVESGCDTEAGEFEGIPVYDAACADSGINQGVVAITLNNLVNGQFNLDPNGSGGWQSVAPDGQSVTFTDTTVPEPSTMISLAFGLLLIAGIARRRRHAN